MTTNDIRSLVRNIRRKYRLPAAGEDGVRRTLQDRGFTVVAFTPDANQQDVDMIISRLDLSDYVSRYNGFTYSDGEFRLVFVRGDLSEAERTMVLAHEAGHILCGHMEGAHFTGSNVTEEMEANEFACRLLRLSDFEKFLYQLATHRAVVLSAVAAIALLAGVFLWTLRERNEGTYYGEFYVTAHGERYHREDCPAVRGRSNLHRFTVEEFESGAYSPCQICLPE